MNLLVLVQRSNCVYSSQLVQNVDIWTKEIDTSFKSISRSVTSMFKVQDFVSDISTVTGNIKWRYGIVRNEQICDRNYTFLTNNMTRD